MKIKKRIGELLLLSSEKRKNGILVDCCLGVFISVIDKRRSGYH
jgi:hypothetical protein